MKIGNLEFKEYAAQKPLSISPSGEFVTASEIASQPAAGMGDIQWGKVMAFLYEHRYDGYLSIEPHGPIWGREPLRETMLLLTRRYIGQFLP